MEAIGSILAFIAFMLLAIILFLMLINRLLPKKLGCDFFGWHIPPKGQSFDGASLTGICPRCKKKVLQDSQGNWF